MAYKACYNSLLIPSSGGGGGGDVPNIRQVLQVGYDAVGESLVGINQLSVDNLTATGTVTSAGINSYGLISGYNLNVASAINCVNVVASQIVDCAELGIAGRTYPIVGTTPTTGNLGNILVRTMIPNIASLPTGQAYTTVFTYSQGFYSGKIEADFIITGGSGGNARARVEVFYGTLSGVNIGYSDTLISSNGDTYTICVPFFVNFLTASNTITVRLTCSFVGGGLWNTTLESDIDMFRIF